MKKNIAISVLLLAIGVLGYKLYQERAWSSIYFHRMTAVEQEVDSFRRHLGQAELKIEEMRSRYTQIRMTVDRFKFFDAPLHHKMDSSKLKGEYMLLKNVSEETIGSIVQDNSCVGFLEVGE